MRLLQGGSIKYVMCSALHYFCRNSFVEIYAAMSELVIAVMNVHALLFI